MPDDAHGAERLRGGSRLMRRELTAALVSVVSPARGKGGQAR
jgi:hypothetical protein